LRYLNLSTEAERDSPAVKEVKLSMFTLNDPVMVMLGVMFFLGMLSFLSGITILILRASNQDVKALTAQAARLVQKGVTDEISGLVGNLSSLLDSMEQLVRTTRGVGVFLMILGALTMSCAAGFAIYISK
jgi:hypothetical protein